MATVIITVAVASAFVLPFHSPTASVAEAPVAHGEPSFDKLSAASWQRISVLPRRFGRANHAELAAFRGRLWAVMNVQHRGQTRVLVLVKAGSSWLGPVGKRTFPASQGLYPHLIANGSDRLCIQPNTLKKVRLHCLRGGRWVGSGTTLWSDDGYSTPGDSITFGNSIVTAREVTSNPSVPKHSLTVNGTPQLQFYALNGSKWDALAASANISPTGGQRAQLFEYGNKLCVAFDELLAVNQPRDSVAANCLNGSAWEPLGISFAGPNGERADLSEAVSVGPTPYISGLTQRGNNGFDVFVKRLDGGKWVDTSLDDTRGSTYSTQGQVFSIGGLLWLARFDQRSEGDFTYKGNFVIRAYDPETGLSTSVGRPLLRDKLISPPFALSLTQVGSSIYALHSQYSRRLRGSQLIVSQLQLP